MGGIKWTVVNYFLEAETAITPWSSCLEISMDRGERELLTVSMGSQRVRHEWVERVNFLHKKHFYFFFSEVYWGKNFLLVSWVSFLLIISLLWGWNILGPLMITPVNKPILTATDKPPSERVCLEVKTGGTIGLTYSCRNLKAVIS